MQSQPCTLKSQTFDSEILKYRFNIRWSYADIAIFRQPQVGCLQTLNWKSPQSEQKQTTAGWLICIRQLHKAFPRSVRHSSSLERKWTFVITSIGLHFHGRWLKVFSKFASFCDLIA
jgi:hypothetical protein